MQKSRGKRPGESVRGNVRLPWMHFT